MFQKAKKIVLAEDHLSMESGQRRIAPYLGAYGNYRFATDNALPSGQPVVGIGNGWSLGLLEPQPKAWRVGAVRT